MAAASGAISSYLGRPAWAVGSSSQPCASCHFLFDPIGFAFENYDAVGQFRTTENGKTIDVSGEVFGTTDPALAGAFVGVKELGQKLAASKMVRDCVATQWFRFAAGRSETERDQCSVSTLQDALYRSGGDLRELFVAFSQTDAFLFRSQGDAP